MTKTLRVFAVVLAVAAGLTAQTRKSKPKEPPRAPAAAPAEAPTAFPVGPKLDAVMLKSLKARSIGPAVMGGRVSDITLDPKDTATFYVALGTGGVMKTTDNGATFEAI